LQRGSSFPEVEFSQTKELGRVNRVDPLGITSLRIRGMWQIDHPNKVYEYLNLPQQAERKLQLFALLSQDKYYSFPREDRNNLESSINTDLSIRDVRIRMPDNPAKLIPAKLISYQK